MGGTRVTRLDQIVKNFWIGEHTLQWYRSMPQYADKTRKWRICFIKVYRTVNGVDVAFFYMKYIKKKKWENVSKKIWSEWKDTRIGQWVHDCLNWTDVFRQKQFWFSLLSPVVIIKFDEFLKIRLCSSHDSSLEPDFFTQNHLFQFRMGK